MADISAVTGRGTSAPTCRPRRVRRGGFATKAAAVTAPEALAGRPWGTRPARRNTWSSPAPARRSTGTLAAWPRTAPW